MYPVTYILFLTLLVSSFLCQSMNQKYLNYSPTEFHCGLHCYNISYPFRLPGRPDYCGHPGYDLTCKAKKSTLMLNLSKMNYQVNIIDYSIRFIYVADPEFTDQFCPQKLNNVTLDFSLFAFALHSKCHSVFELHFYLKFRIQSLQYQLSCWQ